MTIRFPSSFTRPWKQLISSRENDASSEFPRYTADSADSLITTSIPTSLCFGTGHTIYERALIPAIRSATSSIHLVTCFWADSTSSALIYDALLTLALSRADVEPAPSHPLHVTIGLSSRGILQKLMHTSSTNGYVYPPSEWKALGLPDESTLRRGSIQLTVKSLFFTPFSVMHPKYLIVDSTAAWMPSCNVSWERWFEGCIELRGEVVNTLLAFHERVWGLGTATAAQMINDHPSDTFPVRQLSMSSQSDDHASLLQSGGTESPTRYFRLTRNTPTPTILLPSSHHRNPRFSWLSLFMNCDPPMTPLNAALVTLFTNAKKRISIVTPNVTSRPVIKGVLQALARGVDVQIRTSKNMMLLEQLVTAGTTTSWCLRRLVRDYNNLVKSRKHGDVEQQSKLGKLNIYCYKPLARVVAKKDEPVQSHFKMTLVDDEYLLLGSGNMDRASWWTSQELGILLYMPGFEDSTWEQILSERAEPVFIS